MVDGFGVEYVGRNHANHLLRVLNQHYEMSEDWEEHKFTGVRLGWNYAYCHSERMCRLSMNDYIGDLLFHKGHKAPAKLQLSPHQHRAMIYSAMKPNIGSSSMLF